MLLAKEESDGARIVARWRRIEGRWETDVGTAVVVGKSDRAAQNTRHARAYVIDDGGIVGKSRTVEHGGARNAVVIESIMHQQRSSDLLSETTHQKDGNLGDPETHEGLLALRWRRWPRRPIAANTAAPIVAGSGTRATSASKAPTP